MRMCSHIVQRGPSSFNFDLLFKYKHDTLIIFLQIDTYGSNLAIKKFT